MWPGLVRMARDDDGPALGKLFAECQWQDHGVDWSTARPGGWWLVAQATTDAPLAGALQLCLARPFGWIGNLLIHPDHRGSVGLGRAMGGLAATLLGTAQVLLTQNGSAMMLGLVHDDAWETLLARVGASYLGSVRLMGKRL